MKLAILFDRFGPYHVARLKGAMGHAEVFAVEGAPYRAIYDWVTPDLPNGLRHVVLTKQKGDEVNSQIIEQRLNELVAPLEPDAMALPGWSNLITLVALRWCRRRGIPAICMSETNAWDFKRRLPTEMIKRSIVAHYGAGLATNSSQIDYLVQLGIPRNSIFCGYNSIDNDFFRSAAERWRAEPGIPAEVAEAVPSSAKGRYFLASNRFISKKNLIRLIDAYAMFRAGRSEDPADWPLILLGDGEMRPKIEVRINELGLSLHVQLPGFLQLDALTRYYGTAGAFIHASTTEQWGLVINEAMAAGLPVAASKRCGATQYLIEDGVTGFSFDPYRSSEIAEAMRKLAALPPNSPIPEAARAKVDELRPERFGEGLRFASEAALANSVSPGFISRIVLNLVIAHAARKERA